PDGDPTKMNFDSGGSKAVKAWKDIWGCGQGIGAIDDVPAAAQRVARLAAEYRAAKQALLAA
ncbi:MAG: nitronate monooxygenase, partial [Lautropia sp.]|nr:nitronate monooxygenase [Lautropia sp.]